MSTIKAVVTAENGLALHALNTSRSQISCNIAKGTKIELSDPIGLWYKVDGGKGWIDSGLGGYKVDTEASATETTAESSDKKTEETEPEEVANFTTGLGYDSGLSSEEATALIFKSFRGIFGMPYQYMASADPRYGGSSFGKKYTEKIINNMPMLLMTPGKPKFMKGFNSKDRDGVLKSLATKDEDTLSQLLEDKNGKFYSFEFDYSDYYARVNPMCRKVARLMNLQDYELDGTKLFNYNWAEYTADIDAFITSKESVPFYIDSETQVQESFSNSTGESALSGSLNQLSDMSRELQFLLGAGGVEFEALKAENQDAALEQFNSFADKFSGLVPSGILDRLSSGLANVAVGGKLIFPEIWNDSQFSKSYDINIKLRSPDHDPLSIYMNIFVPLLHLIGFVSPAQLSANSYQSPPLIRAFYKGFFNIDMGIITSMNITKGDKGCWTLDGLPTQIDVNFQIKELYNILSLSDESKILDSISNTAQMDYLANLCGLNVNKVDIARSVDIYFHSIKEGVTDKLTLNHFMDVQQYASNLFNAIF